MAAPLLTQAVYRGNGDLWAVDYESPSNAYAAVFAKEPAVLSREDVLTLASNAMTESGCMAVGMDACFDAAGPGLSVLRNWFPKCVTPQGAGNRMLNRGSELAPSPEFMERVLLLTLDVIRAPDGASALERAGCWHLQVWGLAGGAERAQVLLEAGMLELGLATLRQISPVEWVTHRTRDGVMAGLVCTLGWLLSTVHLPGTDMTLLLLDTGFVDVCISVLKVYELRGVSKLPETNVVAVWACTCLLAALDLTVRVTRGG